MFASRSTAIAARLCQRHFSSRRHATTKTTVGAPRVQLVLQMLVRQVLPMLVLQLLLLLVRDESRSRSTFTSRS